MTRQRGVVLAVMITALVVCICFAWLFDAWVDGRSVLTSTQLRLAELRGRRLPAAETEALQRALTAEADPKSGLLITDEKEAGSRLEAMIRSVAQDHRAEILSLSRAAGKLPDNLPVVRGNVHLVISDDSIGLFVKSLESGPPAVFLEQMQVFSRTDSGDGGEQLMLDLQLSLTVYRDVSAAERVLP